MDCHKTLDTYSRPYAKGTVNPVQRETITSLLVVNSKFRSVHNPQRVQLNDEYNLEKKMFASESSKMKDLLVCKYYPEVYLRTSEAENCTVSKNTGYVEEATDFTIELNEPLINVISLKFTGIDMSPSYYPISDYLGTNVFSIRTFRYDMLGISGEYITETIISLPEGIYTEEQLLYKVNDLFAHSSYDTLNAVQLHYDPVSRKYSFTVTDTSGEDIKYGVQLSFANPNYPSRNIQYNLGWMMGFRKMVYTITEDYNVTESPTLRKGINADSPANLKGTRYFFLEVNDFNNNNPPVINYNCNTEYSFNLRNILAKIPNVDDTILMEKYTDSLYKKRQYFGPVRIQKLKFRILDENGRPLKWNDSDYTLNIEVETLNQLC